MNFKDFIRDMPPPQREDFSRRVGIKWETLEFAASGGSEIGVPMAIKVERETFGIVRCEDMRPDIDWSYLRMSVPRRNKKGGQ